MVEQVKHNNNILIHRYSKLFIFNIPLALFKGDYETMKYDMSCFLRGIYRLCIFDYKREKYMNKIDQTYCKRLVFTKEVTK